MHTLAANVHLTQRSYRLLMFTVYIKNSSNVCYLILLSFNHAVVCTHLYEFNHNLNSYFILFQCPLLLFQCPLFLLCFIIHPFICFPNFLPELPTPAESSVPLNTFQNTDSPKSTPSTTRQLAKKKLLLYSSHDSVLNTTSDPVSRQDMSPSPRGILKHSSSSGSFTDSLSLRNSCSSQPTSPLSPESSDNSHSPPLSPSSDLSSSGCLDRKQVRFSSIIQARDTGSLEAQDTKEHGEHGLLDQDGSPVPDQVGEPDMVEFAAETANTSTLPENIENSLVGTQPEPQISTQPNPIDKPDSTPPASSVLSSKKVGEFLASGNWSDGSAAFTTSRPSIQIPFGKALNIQSFQIN